jgi:cell division protein FtsB
MNKRSLMIFLALLLGVLQYQLWFSGSGYAETLSLKQAIAQQNAANQALSNRNAVLQGQIKALKGGKASVVDLARNEIGMIKPGEVFYQFVK